MKILHIVGARPNFMKAAPITSTGLRQAQDKAQYKHAGDGGWGGRMEGGRGEWKAVEQESENMERGGA